MFNNCYVLDNGFCRYQYTLFLKDAGLKVEDSLRFWEEEYSKPRGVSSCCHDWEEKKNRLAHNLFIFLILLIYRNLLSLILIYVLYYFFVGILTKSATCMA